MTPWLWAWAGVCALLSAASSHAVDGIRRDLARVLAGRLVRARLRLVRRPGVSGLDLRTVPDDVLEAARPSAGIPASDRDVREMGLRIREELADRALSSTGRIPVEEWSPPEAWR